MIPLIPAIAFLPILARLAPMLLARGGQMLAGAGARGAGTAAMRAGASGASAAASQSGSAAARAAAVTARAQRAEAIRRNFGNIMGAGQPGAKFASGEDAIASGVQDQHRERAAQESAEAMKHLSSAAWKSFAVLTSGPFVFLGLYKSINKFGEHLVNSTRSLSAFSGGVAQSHAALEAGRHMREIERAGSQDNNIAIQTYSQNKLEEAAHPWGERSEALWLRLSAALNMAMVMGIELFGSMISDEALATLDEMLGIMQGDTRGGPWLDFANYMGDNARRRFGGGQGTKLGGGPGPMTNPPPAPPAPPGGP